MIRQPEVLSAVGLVVQSASPVSPQSGDPNDYVRIRDGKFVLAGKPFVVKGTNYFGSWRNHATIDQGDGIEQATGWAFYNYWDAGKLDADFRFIRSQLNATVVRVGIPTRQEFDSLVRYHNYKPWYNPDGTITDQYRSELIQLADVAYANGIRVQFCLLWSLGNEIIKDPENFRPGGVMDQFYSNNIRSVAMALSRHPGVLAYSVGNEIMVNWPINGRQTSWYEGLAAGFVVRRWRDLRAVAPRQLITTDEGAAPSAKQWYSPGPEFALLTGVEDDKGSQSIRLADAVDYLGPHFYPETFQLEDSADGFVAKIADAKKQLASYLQAAKALGKPVAINEFGLPISPKTLTRDQYAAVRDRYFQALVDAGQKLGLQGLLAWGAIPEITLPPGRYTVNESKLNIYSPVEVDIEAPDHIRRRILFYQPVFNLFEWQDGSDLPSATPAARAIASGWAALR